MKKPRPIPPRKTRFIPAATKDASPATIRMLSLLRDKQHAELVAALQDAAQQDGIALDDVEGRPPWTLQLAQGRWERAAYRTTE